MKAKGLSNPGLKRSNNQDSFHIDPGDRLFLVADGMGGHYGGEVASQTTIKEIESYWKNSYENEKSVDYNINKAINRANMEIVNYKKNMGTTLELFTLKDREGWIGHVGDSRIYCLSGKKLKLLTRDHTKVMQLIESGDLTPESAVNYPFQHVITRAVGVHPELYPDIFKIDLEPDDIIIMCSDGLTGDLAKKIVREEEIIEVLRENTDLEKACELLIEIANNMGGPDNITVVLVKIEKEDLNSNK